MNKYVPLLLLVLVGLFTAYITLNFEKRGLASHGIELKFIPRGFQYCEHLFQNTSIADFSMSTTYTLISKQFQGAVAEATRREGVKGNSGQLKEEILVMHYVAGLKFVKTVCETGFNMGHSSLIYLTANDEAIVHSFDFGNYQYVHTMSKFMGKTFPSRFFIHFGDSVQAIPDFIKANPGFQCDLMLVDGGHTYDAALADMKNFASIANLEENIIIFDDYITKWGHGFGKAWVEMTQNGTINEMMRCTFMSPPNSLQRGFVLGSVMRRP